ncbi:hypothetical protein [Acidovorax sp. MR-S7]|uniref:hypothetical protein n=1 Tax=Acidovorax sp. MR-S7 TaxID=1268622 RepID=UPI0003778159|nr:hypothetical protein [Acidovorax sp. MR-S7]GAD23340.1 hypothetical protein AVS7_03100 [Acidovorax sp. MR-S7]
MMMRTLAAALAFSALSVLALLLTHTGAWAAGATDPATFRLTPALLDRMDQVAAELKHLPQQDDDGDDAHSVEDIARKLDAHPQVRAALARQNLSSREYATAMLAALQAGILLAMDKAPGAKNTQAFTPAQLANVEVLRARQKGRP